MLVDLLIAIIKGIDGIFTSIARRIPGGTLIYDYLIQGLIAVALVFAGVDLVADIITGDLGDQSLVARAGDGLSLFWDGLMWPLLDWAFGGLFGAVPDVTVE